MKFRSARHTIALQPLIHFYGELIGLQVLGDFKDHDGYDGVFLGVPGNGWHLEFTVSGEAPAHQPDDDDLLVFYVDQTAYDQIRRRMGAQGIPEVRARNPYWHANGVSYHDPDGFGVMIALK